MIVILVFCLALAVYFLSGHPNCWNRFIPGPNPRTDNIILPLTTSLIFQVIIICLSILLIPIFKNEFFSKIRKINEVDRSVFLISIFLFVVIVTNLISFLVFEHFPRDVDNVAKIYQAKTFISGRLYVHVPPGVESFQPYAIVAANNKFFSKYNPGSSIVYALWGKITNIMWGINPLLSGLTLVLLYFILKPWYGEAIARLSVILACVSPFFIFMSSSFHSHVPCLFFLITYLFFLAKGSRNYKWHYFFLSGFFLGMAFTTRPYTAVLVSLPGLLWIFWMNRFRNVTKRLLFFSIAFVIPFALLLWYNHQLTSNPLLFPFHVAEPDEQIGFGYKGHNPFQGIKNTFSMLKLLNLNLLGWPFSCLFIVLLLLFVKKNRWDILLIASVSLLVIGYGFYYWIDFSIGPRFYFSAVPFLLVLTARGIYSFHEYMKFNQVECRAFLLAFISCSFIFSFAVYLYPLVQKYHNDYNGLINTRISSLVEEKEIDNALIFVKKGYESAFLANPIDFKGPVLYAKDLGPEKNTALIKAYPERKYFSFDFDTKTRGGILTPYSSKNNGQ